ncbi:hypothetical protein H5410_001846 [Solanum commersonii]|uniref:Uncharacterized protein n=1 Tax=Solanum commersonii TaxID=4109 RepID=A0A9J6B0B7_SOLCO|nr:hypothetical protein H5410_001846 [Solanum commersonii]
MPHIGLGLQEMKACLWSLMYGHNWSDKIRNEVTQEKVGVAFMVDKMREARLRWFRHVLSENIQEVGCRGHAKR